LPRVNEINIDVDESPKAYYFTQALNGVYTRMAIMALILGLKKVKAYRYERQKTSER